MPRPLLTLLIALAAAATVTIVLGIFPQPVIELVNQAGVFIR